MEGGIKKRFGRTRALPMKGLSAKGIKSSSFRQRKKEGGREIKGEEDEAKKVPLVLKASRKSCLRKGQAPARTYGGGRGGGRGGGGEAQPKYAKPCPAKFVHCRGLQSDKKRAPSCQIRKGKRELEEAGEEPRTNQKKRCSLGGKRESKIHAC